MTQKIQDFDLFGNPISYQTEKEIKAEKAVEELARKKVSVDLEAESSSGLLEIATIETVAKFKNSCITQVDIYRRNGATPPMNPNAKDNLLSQNGNSNSYNGYLSPASRRQVEQMLSVWLTAIELSQKLNQKKQEVNKDEVFPTFITLTLPSTQWHSDNTIKEEILKPFIKWLTSSSDEYFKIGPRKGEKKGFGVNVYLWRAEPQKNKNIHFHIICDRYIPWPRIRQKWNQCCEYLGYVSRYGYMQNYYNRNGFVPDEDRIQNDMDLFKDYYKAFKASGNFPKNTHPVYEKYINLLVKYNKDLTDDYCRNVAIARQKEVYNENVKNGWNNPNSTDIHAIQNLESVTAYVVKYVAKKPTEIPLPANQAIKFNETSGKEYLYTYEEKLDKYTGELTQVEVNMQDLSEYTIKFEERIIRGRIWGCSDTLRGFVASEDDQVEVDEYGRSFKIQEEYSEDTGKFYEVKTPVPVMKFFTKTISEAVVILKTDAGQSSVYVSPQEILSQETIEYITEMCNIVGNDEIDRITAQVGASFAKMRGKIIPFRPEQMGFKPKKGQKKAIVKHADILKKYAPVLYKEYLAYYNHIYNSIYKS